MTWILARAATDEGFDWTPWAAVGSTAIAAVALLLGFSNRRTSRKALRIAERQEQRRVPQLNLSLTEGVSWRPSGGGVRVVGAQILAVNPAEQNGTLVSADLHVTYTATRGVVTTVKIAHGRTSHGLPGGLSPLRLPAALPGSGALSGWLTFEISDELTNGQPIERFTVHVTDSRGISGDLHLGVLREVMDGAAT